MAEERLRVKIVKREIIRPFSPTPSHLKTFKLSLLDQVQPVVYGPILLFYTKNDLITSDQQSQRLKASLSETLSRFYPVAGRMNDNVSIECSDEGAKFIEAWSDGLLSAFLSQPANPKSLQKFLPDVVITSQEAATWPLLHVQATHFVCGGLAVGVCLSHKFADATTLGNFVKSWAKSSRGSGETALLPTFGAASSFPPMDLSSPVLELKKVECATKRFVFEKEKIASLKARAAFDETGGLRDPTRVEAVTALIWKCALNAATSGASLEKKKIVVTQSINIRRMADPPFPDNLAGNLVGHFSAETDEAEPDVKRLAAELRKGLMEYREKKGKRLRGDEAYEVVCESMREARELFVRDDISVLIFTSLCNFGLYEGADFGWGRPAWATIPVVAGHLNVVLLMDTAGGGVEAWVTLSKQDMALFETDSLLAKFAYNASATKSSL